MNPSNILIPSYEKLKQGQQALESCRIISDWDLISANYSQYLHDESKVGADKVLSLSFPESVEQLAALLQRAAAAGEPTTVSSARTGIAAGAVAAQPSHVVSLERLRGIEPVQAGPAGDKAMMVVGPCTTLAEVNEYLAEHFPEWLFPVDPTETTASIGGMCATNASGARTLYYGPTRDWVRAITVVLADGGVLELKRGEAAARAGELILQSGDGERRLKIAAIPKPDTKHTVGYCYSDDIDAVDVFIGSEGTLGVIARVELVLTKRPKHSLYLLQFFESEDTALDFVAALRSRSDFEVTALEFCDHRSLRYVAGRAATVASRAAKMVTDRHRAAVYCEFILDSEEQLDELTVALDELLGTFGASLEDSAGGTEDRDFRDLKTFRHAVPETINAIIAARKRDVPSLHKIATDMAVPDRRLQEIYHLYRDTLEERGLEFAVFGHAGNNHFHVNLLPRSEVELALAKEIYLDFAHRVVAMDGAVCAEHGIGRLKKAFLGVQYSAEEIDRMAAIKSFFDPGWLLNRGVLLDRPS